MSAVHILNQYIWPDAAPTGVYAEQLAAALQEAGQEVVLVGGSGAYRRTERSKPDLEMRIVPHWKGKRGNHLATFREYFSVHDAFAAYIKEHVRRGDTVIVSSAPPTTLALAKDLRQIGARSIYWLQDYYPELIRGIWDYPQVLQSALAKWWDVQLGKWDCVVKVAGNIRGAGENVRLIRNWPTLDFGKPLLPLQPRTALYAGNLGYGHHLPAFVQRCRELLDSGYELKIHADGPGVRKLPDWLASRGAFRSEQELAVELQAAEIHLIAGHPEIQEAIFPSKIWNSLTLGRKIVASGFKGLMAEELAAVQQLPFKNNLSQWCDLVLDRTTRLSKPHLAEASARQ